MSEDTMITNKKEPNPQRFKWKNVGLYDTYEKADIHRKSLEGPTKVRRCGSFGTKFVVKVGTPVKESTQ